MLHYNNNNNNKKTPSGCKDCLCDLFSRFNPTDMSPMATLNRF